MSRESRFDKLESERAQKPPESGRSSTARFEEAPERANEPLAHAPAMEHALDASENSSEATAPQHKRFETDGANHLSIDTDELVRLPFLRCPECSRDSSKFDRRCIFCESPLDTPRAREFNLQILAGYDAERERQKTEHRQSHEEGIRQIVEGEFKKQVEREQIASMKMRFSAKAGFTLASVVCFAIALWARSFCVSGVLLVLGSALLLPVLPQGVLAALNASVKSRWRL
jgi:hypothetical protein